MDAGGIGYLQNHFVRRDVMSPFRKFSLIIGFTLLLMLPFWAVAQTPTQPPTQSSSTNSPGTLDDALSATATASSGVMTLHYGDVINGSIGGDIATPLYHFVGKAGDLIEIRIATSRLLPLLLLNSSGTNIGSGIENPDTIDGLNTGVLI